MKQLIKKYTFFIISAVAISCHSVLYTQVDVLAIKAIENKTPFPVIISGYAQEITIDPDETFRPTDVLRGSFYLAFFKIRRERLTNIKDINVTTFGPTMRRVLLGELTMQSTTQAKDTKEQSVQSSQPQKAYLALTSGESRVPLFKTPDIAIPVQTGRALKKVYMNVPKIILREKYEADRPNIAHTEIVGPVTIELRDI